jgi:cytochrome c
MFKSPSCFLLLLLIVPSLVWSANTDFGIGRLVTDTEINGWDVDIRYDGLGLPAGSGTPADGEAQYDTYCASCHGVFGEGEGRWPVLAGGQGTLTDARPVKTVGSYWPFASTLFDYIRRAMPFTAPMSLSNQQVYDITAYVLYLNDLIEEDFVLNQDNLATIDMPNEHGFFVDDRPDAANTRCMEACLDITQVNLVSAISGITPVGHFIANADAPGASHAAQHKLEQQKAAERKSKITGSPVAEDTAITTAPALTETALAGQAVYQTACSTCHDAGLAGAPSMNDPSVWTERLAQGMTVLVEHAINGYIGVNGVMPPKGGRMDLTDDQVKHAVQYMFESVQKN